MLFQFSRPRSSFINQPIQFNSESGIARQYSYLADHKKSINTTIHVHVLIQFLNFRVKVTVSEDDSRKF